MEQMLASADHVTHAKYGEVVYDLMCTCRKLVTLLRPVAREHTVIGYTRDNKRKKVLYKCHWRLDDMPRLKIRGLFSFFFFILN